ncbi:2-aminoethylphosphonate--pyruvate transaminase [Solibacillus sp. FSL K6-1523]|uniref:2-aminoethylphosphonate--pyruvate transaminase n=1 Tax=Solibacillus sp. FSL K6-1523 TaxID=2921471 RepID=UPI0030F7D618
MNRYKLLTPGPLTTTNTVRNVMNEDRCTWDDEYKQITQTIRKQLLEIAGVTEEKYTTVLMQGSGSFVVEAVLTTAVQSSDKVLFITNGAYGERMVQMANAIGIQHTQYETPYGEAVNASDIATLLQQDPTITHVAMVHCETTTGILNPIEEVIAVAKQHNAQVIIDAMSSFGGVPIDMEALQIDYLVSSANKCIQGVPGFGFVIANIDRLSACQGVARSVSLDLYDQWQTMKVDGKWRFTSPTHVVAAFAQALVELEEEGGVAARFTRYAANNSYLRKEMQAMGFAPYIDEADQSPIITSYYYPTESFEFTAFYEAIKQKGFVLYPGKLTDADTFRIGNIGDIHLSDMEQLVGAIKEYMGVQV